MFELPFGKVWKAGFIDRPNRFLVRCESPEIGRVDAFLPNPGRLNELLFPGSTLDIAAAAAGRTGKSQRKTKYTVLAVEREGSPVFLHTHLTNQVAEYLVAEKLVPSLEHARVLRREVTVGRSRFDFLIREKGRDLLMEVKSCTLFGNGVAMFPDAVTERGRRHLLELAEQGRPGARPVVLFVVHFPRVEWFMPDYHTDLAFSRTLLDVRNLVRILPVAVEWIPGLTLTRRTKLLDVPWSYVEREARDRGSYVLVMRLDRNRQVSVGELGSIPFTAGYYLYVGSAMKTLAARIARHQRHAKKLRWHVDYLRAVADSVTPLPIRSSQRRECDIAEALAEILAGGPPRFGSSDCKCKTHLFYSETDPLTLPEFHTVLQRFRMQRPAL